MRARENEKIVFTYIPIELIQQVKKKLNEFNLTYSGRIGIASYFYSCLLKEKINETLNNKQKMSEIAEKIIEETGLGQRR